MFQSSYFKSRLDPVTMGGGGLEGETRNFGIRLELRDWVET